MGLALPILKVATKVHHTSHEIDIGQLRAGHHIYVLRRGLNYTHHGIYIGDGRVIHFIPPNSGPKSGPKSSGTINACQTCRFLRKMQHGVEETCLDCFLRGGVLYVYWYGISLDLSGQTLCPTCTTRESKPDFEVVQTAKQKLTEGFGTYDLISHNCENFATFCKTGQSFTQQVFDYISDASLLLL